MHVLAIMGFRNEEECGCYVADPTDERGWGRRGTDETVEAGGLTRR